MSNLLRRGQQLIASTLKAHGSDTATYRRNAASVSIAVSAGQPDQAFEAMGGGRRRNDRREFIITAADLVLSGEVTRPLANDVIDLVEDGVTKRFLVSPDGGQPEYELADAFGIMLRIRASFQKEIA